MGAFLVRRLLWGLFTVWCISVITFGIFFLTDSPDNIATRIAGKNPTPELVAGIKRDWCLDKPRVVTYTCLMRDLLSGELKSQAQGINVVPAVLAAIPVTMSLAFFAAVIWLVVGVTFGIQGALSPDSAKDRVLMVASLLGVSMPMAWLSIYSLKVWTDMMPAFPAGGYLPVSEGGIFGWAYHVLLPAATLAVIFAGIYARMTRTNVRQAMIQEHVRTATAKGLPPRYVFAHHVLRTGLIPILVLFGLDLAVLLGGAVFTESIFGLPGLGSMMMTGISMLDIPTLVACTMVAAAFVVTANIVVDIIQAMVDPRIRLA